MQINPQAEVPLFKGDLGGSNEVYHIFRKVVSLDAFTLHYLRLEKIFNPSCLLPFAFCLCLTKR